MKEIRIQIKTPIEAHFLFFILLNKARSKKWTKKYKVDRKI